MSRLILSGEYQRATVDNGQWSTRYVEGVEEPLHDDVGAADLSGQRASAR